MSNGRQHHERHGTHARGERQGPGGERPVPLGPVPPVGVEVEQVVDHIARRREQAEDQKAQGGLEIVARPGQGPGQHDRHEEQEVLGPLVQAQGLEPGAGRVVGDREGLLDRHRRSQMPGERRHPPGDDGPGRGLPDRHVHDIVADIDEAVAVTLADGRELVVAGEIDGAVAAAREGEDAEPPGDRLDDPVVGRREQGELATARGLRLEPGQHRLVERQSADIERGPLGDVALEGRLAGPEPERQPHQIRRPLPHQAQELLMQRVGEDQRPVEIDAQGQRRGLGLQGPAARLELGRCPHRDTHDDAVSPRNRLAQARFGMERCNRPAPSGGRAWSGRAQASLA